MLESIINFDGNSLYIHLGIRVWCAFISQDGDVWTSLFAFTLIERGDCSFYVSHNSFFAPEICHGAQIAYQFY